MTNRWGGPVNQRPAPTAPRLTRARRNGSPHPGTLAHPAAEQRLSLSAISTHDAAQRLTSAWGEPPRWNENETAWVERVTRPRVDTDPRVIEATEQQEAAANAVRSTLEPNDLPRLRIYARIFGIEAVMSNRAAYVAARPHANAENATRTAHRARAEVEALRALTPAEAIHRIEQTRAAEQVAREAADRALNERQRQLASRSRIRDSGPIYDGPSLSR